MEDVSKTYLNWAQLVAIIIAGCWVFIQFIYHDIYLVSKSPLNSEITIGMTPHLSGEKIKVINVVGEVTNRGERKMYLTNGFYQASTATIREELLDNNQFLLKMDFDEIPEKFLIRNKIVNQKYISLGPMHSGVRYLLPGETAQYQVQIPVNRVDGRYQIVSISEHVGIGGQDKGIELEPKLVKPKGRDASYNISFCKRVSVNSCQTILDFDLMEGFSSEQQLKIAMKQVFFEQNGGFKIHRHLKALNKKIYRCKKGNDKDVVKANKCIASLKEPFNKAKKEIAELRARLLNVGLKKGVEYNKLYNQATDRLSSDKELLQSSEFRPIKRSGNIYVSWDK